MRATHTFMEKKHFPVMLEEVLDICSPHKGGRYLDCTFGGGSYTEGILNFPDTNVIALDRDKTVIDIAEDFKKKFKSRFEFFHNKFSSIDKITKGKFDAIIFDLGVSSFQLDDMKRSFSFKSTNKLDMSMGLSESNAFNVVNFSSGEILKNIIRILGEEKEASRIVKNIIKERNIKKIETADELVKIILQSKKKDYKKKIDPSTQTFQAIRIFVNQEISELINGLINATKDLKPGGKLILISFHSLEDRIIKFYFKNYAINKSKQNKYLPMQKNKGLYLFNFYKNKIFKPSENEINLNPRSRSAKLRVAIRSKNQFEEPSELRKKFKIITDMEKNID
jgi:16S rRNA (cytosine1402-N4)-methyltransferase